MRLCLCLAAVADGQLCAGEGPHFFRVHVGADSAVQTVTGTDRLEFPESPVVYRVTGCTAGVSAVTPSSC